MSFQAEATVTVGQVLTAAIWNLNVRDNVNYLANPPHCAIYNSAAISITTSGVAQALTFNSERVDVGGLHSTVTNTGRITIVDAGFYLVVANDAWASSATGALRQTRIRLNGSTLLAIQNTPPSATVGSETSVPRLYYLNAGDYVEMVVIQDSGGALNITVAANYSPEFEAIWMAA